MNYLYEYSDTLNRPYEAFLFDTSEHEFPVRPHWHHYVEILYVIEGNMIARVNERDYFLGERNFILFHNEDIHSLLACSMDKCIFMGIKFDVSRLNVNTQSSPKLATLLMAARDQRARILFDDEKERLEFERYFRESLSEMNEAPLGYEVAIHARLCLMFLGLIRIWQEEGISFDDLSDYISSTETSMTNILEYIDLHVEDNLKVRDLAAMCNMSYSSFARSFMNSYGRSCKDYLEMVRVEKAEEMLKFTDRPLSDIAQELGYSDSSHFVREFKKFKGITPGSYRN